MNTRKRITLAAVTVVTVGGVALGVPALASTVSTPVPAVGSAVGSGYGQGQAQGIRPPGGPGPGETALTGETADSVRTAASKAVPGGTVLRVETDRGGVYEAHVRKSDGTEVVVKVDKDFKVTSVDAFAGRGGHGPDGHGPDGDGPGGQGGPGAGGYGQGAPGAQGSTGASGGGQPAPSGGGTQSSSFFVDA